MYFLDPDGTGPRRRHRHHHHPDDHGASGGRGVPGDGANAADATFDPREDGPRRGHRRGPGFGPGHGRGRGRRGRGRRAPRGDVRTAILLLLAEEPMHGYQLMSAIADRTGGRWTPSPGAVYPALSQLEDEGLVTVTADSGRKVAALTDAGRLLVAEQRDGWSDPFVEFGDAASGPDLRDLLQQVHAATRQVGMSGSAAQLEAAASILRDTRRSLYLVLADGPDGPDGPDGEDGSDQPGEPLGS